MPIPLPVAQWQPEPRWCQTQKLDKQDLSLIAAATEHRSWINTLHKYVHDQVDSPPPLDLTRCGFGQWLTAKGSEIIQDESFARVGREEKMRENLAD